jgi:hypothetical protein
MNIKRFENYRMGNDNKPIISYDFDGVLHRSVIEGTTHPINFWEPETWEPFDKMHELMFQEAKENIIWVITKRDNNMKKAVEYYINSWGLPVEYIICTNGYPKWDILEHYNISKHYDDDPDMIYEYEGNLKDLDVELIHVDPVTQKLTKTH